MKKWKLIITSLILGNILHSQPVSAKSLSNIAEFTVKSSLLAQSNLKDAVIYFHRGMNRDMLGDAQAAIEEYNEALRLQPTFAEVYYKRGVSRHKLGDLKGAIADFNQAISLNSNYAAFYNNRGFTRHKLGDLKGAITDFNQALTLNDNFPEAYQNRGISRNQLGDKQQAITDLKTAANLFQQQKRISNYQEVIDILKKIDPR